MLQAEEDRNESIATATDDQSRDKPQMKIGRGRQRKTEGGRETEEEAALGGSAHKKPNAIIAKLISHR